jgi:hypothetical protein
VLGWLDRGQHRVLACSRLHRYDDLKRMQYEFLDEGSWSASACDHEREA